MIDLLFAVVVLASQPATPVMTYRMKTTAYCPCAVCCEKWAGGGKTSTGKDASLPGVAADPKVMLYGTVLDIPGVGVRVVDDTGGAMRQSAKRQIAHIDIRMSSHEEALAWGVRWLDVGILQHGKPKPKMTKTPRRMA